MNKDCNNCGKNTHSECQKYQMFKEVDFGTPLDVIKGRNKPNIEIARDCDGYTDARLKVSKRDIELLINNFSFLKASVDFNKCLNPLIQVAVDDIDKILADLKN